MHVIQRGGSGRHGPNQNPQRVGQGDIRHEGNGAYGDRQDGCDGRQFGWVHGAAGCAGSEGGVNTYDDAAHIYMIKGRAVPSVTTIVNHFMPHFDIPDLAYYLQRGKAVHAAAAYVAQGIAFDCHESIAGHVAAIRKFYADVAPVVLSVETQVFSELNQYAGTYDLKANIGGKVTFVDFKCGIDCPERIAYQCAAYAHADGDGVQCFGVELNADGTYKLTPIYRIKNYINGFLAMRTVYGIQQKQRGK
jgi:hypothetical protein